MQEQVYHILITKECTHKCPLCCNRLYDLDNLPTVTGEMLRTAHTVCLTGGEPFLLGQRELVNLCKHIRIQYPNIEKLYVYTSGSDLVTLHMVSWIDFFKYANGINIAPKNANEWVTLRTLLTDNLFIRASKGPEHSNRIYLFDNQTINGETFLKNVFIPDTWQVIGRKWDREFKTPENEHFVRLPILY